MLIEMSLIAAQQLPGNVAAASSVSKRFISQALKHVAVQVTLEKEEMNDVFLFVAPRRRTLSDRHDVTHKLTVST